MYNHSGQVYINMHIRFSDNVATCVTSTSPQFFAITVLFIKSSGYPFLSRLQTVSLSLVKVFIIHLFVE